MISHTMAFLNCCEETHVFLMYPAFQDDYPGVKIMSRLPLQSGTNSGPCASEFGFLPFPTHPLQKHIDKN